MKMGKLDTNGRSALSGLEMRLEQKVLSPWDDQWTNWDDLGPDDSDPEWGDISEGPDQPGPDDR
jgi:hypothetical protein